MILVQEAPDTDYQYVTYSRDFISSIQLDTSDKDTRIWLTHGKYCVQGTVNPEISK